MEKIDKRLNKAIKICQEKSLRFTDLRKKVLTIILQNKAPTKAYDILQKLGSVASNKPPTVYRALDFLLENGLIHRLNSINAYISCSHPLRHNQCYFLICSGCGVVSECCGNDIKQAIEKTTKSYNFYTKSATVEIEGSCNKCVKL